MADEPEIKGLAALVPEIYYDLIARVPPGTLVVLALVVFGYSQPLASLKVENVGSASLLLLFVAGAGYSIGILLGPVSWAVHTRYRYSVWRAALIEQDYGMLLKYLGSRFELSFLRSEAALDVEALTSAQIDRIDRVMHDYLKRADTGARVILPKMRAEAALCDNLFVSFVGVAIVVGVSILRSQSHVADHWGLALLLTAGCLASIAAARYRTRRLIERQFSYLAVVHSRISTAA